LRAEGTVAGQKLCAVHQAVFVAVAEEKSGRGERLTDVMIWRDGREAVFSLAPKRTGQMWRREVVVLGPPERAIVGCATNRGPRLRAVTPTKGR
jgi:hypothetical protein